MHSVLTSEALVLDSEATAKVRRRALSASTAKALRKNCAASFAYSKLAGEKRPDPFAATDQGTAAHAVLEELYQLPGPQRTERRAINILLALQDRWQRGMYPQLGNPVTRAKFQSEVIAKFAGIFEIEDPQAVEVVRTEWPLDGLHVRDVPFIGYIDRTDRTVTPTGKEGLRIVDFKTGKVIKREDIRKYGDEHGDQIRLYAAALEASGQTDEPIVEGRVYYTRHGASSIVAVAKNRIAESVGDFVQAWDIHNEMANAGRFPTKVGPLCGWCPLVLLCPAAQASDFNHDRTPSQTALESSDLIETDPPVHHGSDVPPTDVSEPATPDDSEGAPMTDHKLSESKPYEKRAFGVLNGASYAATGFFGMASLAYDDMHAKGAVIQKATLPAYAEALCSIVSELQESLSGSDDFQEGTNTRLRGVLRSVLDSYPAPFGKDADAWTAWRAGAVQRAKAICSTALRLAAHEGQYTFDADALAGIGSKS